MNSQILITGFVAVGLGGMAWFFGPSFSSEEVHPEPVSYQSSASQSNAPTAVTAQVDKADSEPDTFVWEDTKKKTVGSEMLKELGVPKSPTQAATDKPARTSGLAKVKKEVTEQPKVSFADNSAQKPTSSSKTKSFVSTADDDLSDFFGASKPKSTPVVKTTPAEPTRTEPVRVARKPEPVVQPKPVVKKTPAVAAEPASKDKEMVVVTPPAVDDAPKFSSWEKAPKEPELSAAPTEPSEPSEPTMVKKESEMHGSLTPVGTQKKESKASITKVKISNPAETSLTVTFLVNGKKIVLKPRQSYVIRKSPEVNVKFNRGGTFGVAVQSLKEGEYRFSVSREEGWKLAE